MARNRNDNRYSGRKKKSPMRVIFGWVMFIGVFLMLLFVLVPLVGATMKVTDGAMGPTLGIGDTVAVNHIAYSAGNNEDKRNIGFELHGPSAGREACDEQPYPGQCCRYNKDSYGKGLPCT